MARTESPRRLPVTKGLLTTLVIVATLVLLPVPDADSVAARTQSSNCPAAIPNDNGDDAWAIQACLDSGTDVILVAGVYDIEDKIRFRSDDRLLTSIGGKATLKARSSLDLSILQVQGADYYEISELILDGNRANRNVVSICAGSFPGANGSNLHFNGTGFVIHHVDTINAPCGSGMEGTGTDFEIHSIYAADNGGEASGPGSSYTQWADGLTVNRCTGGYVHHVYAANNTDVGIVVAEAQDCTVRFNEVVNDQRYAFAGMHVAVEDSYGSAFKDNEIASGYNKLSMGLAVGPHPWNASVGGGDAGEVRYNSISGAAINLAVDGISDGTVTDNTVTTAQGTVGLCSFSGNVTYGHIGSATVQSGTCKILHGNCGCQ